MVVKQRTGERNMVAVSNYWRLVRIDSSGHCSVDEIPEAKALITHLFPSDLGELPLPEEEAQRVLFALWRNQGVSENDRTSAESCLRCIVSHYIQQVCAQIAARFGHQHQFTRNDLLGLILDTSVGRSPNRRHGNEHPSLTQTILQSFDPSRAGLKTWVMRQVRHHPEVKRFLAEQGVCLVTDWAILKDIRVEQARQILVEFHALATLEVEQSCSLLKAYHTVYRGDRLQQRQQGKLEGRAECQPPTPEQLNRIADLVFIHHDFCWSLEQVMHRLQTLAKHLRLYRIYMRSGVLPTESLENPTVYDQATSIQAPSLDEEQEERSAFLEFYQQQLVVGLDLAIGKVVGDRLTYFQRKKPQMVEPFLTALYLFHCRGYPMGEIASEVGLKAQFQVTRLMKLKELRASVQAVLTQWLFDQVMEQAATYRDPTQLSTFGQHISAALNEDVASLMQQSEAEATAVKRRPLTSLFAQRLCYYLETRRTTS
ncbi:MAG: hypothetical protein VKL39_15115 [Leptolyngbyaceae bacterium]|nr:hypothetical protein [Leptolyngbyaceae bacterium]